MFFNNILEILRELKENFLKYAGFIGFLTSELSKISLSILLGF